MRLGAWALGLIHFDRSPRRCDPAVAAEIAAAFRRKCEIVGVFVNPTLEEIDRAVENAGLTHRAAERRGGHLLLRRGRAPHRGQGRSRRSTSPAPPISTRPRSTAPTSTSSTVAARASGAAPARASTGACCASTAPRCRRSSPAACDPENVAEAIAVTHPYAVDVASGVEAEPGRKDHAAMEAFFEAAKAASVPARMSAVEERFGPYGGRYVPETLIPALDELTAAWAAARGDEDFRVRLASLRRDFIGRPTPLYLAERLSERAGRRVYLKREDLAHTGAHKINNAVGQVLLAAADGQAADHRRDRRRPARRRHRDGLRSARSRVRRLHGQRGHPPPSAERRADEAARGRGRAGRGGRPHAQGGGQRRDPRLGRERRDDALRDRLGGRSGALPGPGARSAAGDRRRGARAGARGRGSAARRG